MTATPKMHQIYWLIILKAVVPTHLRAFAESSSGERNCGQCMENDQNPTHGSPLLTASQPFMPQISCISENSCIFFSTAGL